MRYTSANAFRKALETRLRAQAQETRLPLVRLRKAVVFDRVLARLLIVAEGRWILKGGLALDFRFGSRTRTTKDMDLGRHRAAQTLLNPILAVSVADEAHWSAQHNAWIVRTMA